MKKIIALAVASAFVAPAMAADITVSGELEYVYVAQDEGQTTATNNAPELVVKATEEFGGTTITGSYVLTDDAASLGTDGSNIKVSGTFGKVAVGDVSGALDSVGDYTDVASFFGGFAGDGDDHFIVYTLPLPVEVNVSYTPDVYSAVSDASVDSNNHGISIEHSFGPVSVYAGQDTSLAKTTESKATAYGIRYKANGITVAYEMASEDVLSANKAEALGIDTDTYTTDLTANGDDLELTSLAVAYSFGDFDLAFENHQFDQGSATLEETTVMSVQYNFGPLDLYIATESKDVAETDKTAVGVEYAF